MRRRYLIPLVLSATLSMSPTWRSSLDETLGRYTPSKDASKEVSNPSRPVVPPHLDRAIYNDLAALLEALGEHPFPYTPPTTTGWFVHLHERVGGMGFSIPGTGLYHIRDGLSPVDRAVTIAHELAHLQGYPHESEAEALACLTLLNSKDPFLRASGRYERSVIRKHPTLPASLLRKRMDTSSRPSPDRSSALFKKVYAFFVPQKSYTEGAEAILSRLEARLGPAKVSHLRPR